MEATTTRVPDKGQSLAAAVDAATLLTVEIMETTPPVDADGLRDAVAALRAKLRSWGYTHFGSEAEDDGAGEDDSDADEYVSSRIAYACCLCALRVCAACVCCVCALTSYAVGCEG